MRLQVPSVRAHAHVGGSGFRVFCLEFTTVNSACSISSEERLMWAGGGVGGSSFFCSDLRSASGIHVSNLRRGLEFSLV